VNRQLHAEHVPVDFALLDGDETLQKTNRRDANQTQTHTDFDGGIVS
jgi:hypothetical protein